MNLSILTAVLLGLVLHPALALYSQKTSQNGQIIFGQDSQITITGISQGVRINSQTRVVIIEQKTRNLSWKTIWNYNRGIIATKVTQQNACYISAMNRNEIPSFDNLARLAAERRNQIGLGRASRRITFVTNGLVNNLSSYGMDIMAMCSGVTTYRAQQVHVFQGLQVNLGSCITLDVLRVVELKYCNGNGNWNDNWTGQWDHNWNHNWTGQWDHNWNQNWTGQWDHNWNQNWTGQWDHNWNGQWDHNWNQNWTGQWQNNWNNDWNDNINGNWNGKWNITGNWNGNWPCNFPNCNNQQIIPGQGSHISISGVSQSMSVSSQTMEAIIEQKSNRISWKTIWNYNTGIIATKVMQTRTCYISTMNRSEMPTFAALLRVAAERRNLMNLGRPSRRITFVTNGLVSNLSSYGAHVISMCSGLPTYRAQEVQGPLYNQQSCTTLDILRLVELRYCSGHGHILN
uniref:BRICHOS domain-containing protein n=1 Tax=Cyanistes caeruleus TaxID=156563 RepID=A0A8C0ZDI9_CYACU